MNYQNNIYELIRILNPTQIFLCGSYARNCYNKNSDIDLLFDNCNSNIQQINPNLLKGIRLEIINEDWQYGPQEQNKEEYKHHIFLNTQNASVNNYYLDSLRKGAIKIY